MKKTELEKRIEQTLAKAGWKYRSFKLHEGGVRSLRTSRFSVIVVIG